MDQNFKLFLKTEKEEVQGDQEKERQLLQDQLQLFNWLEQQLDHLKKQVDLPQDRVKGNIKS